MQLLREMFGVTNIEKATDEQLKKAAEVLSEQQTEMWPQEKERWGLKGKTPQEQREMDEAKGPVKGGGEAKG